MAKKLTKTLSNKIRSIYIKNPHNFNLKETAVKYDIDIAALEYLTDEWKAELIKAGMFEPKTVTGVKPIPSNSPRSVINDNTLSITSKAMTLHHELLNTIGIAVAAVKNVLESNPDGVYCKSYGNVDTYGRTTEFIKDLLPALQLTAEYINPNTALNRIITSSGEAENVEAMDVNYPTDPIEAAKKYQDLIKEVEDDIDSL